MPFNPDLNIQAQEVLISRKMKKSFDSKICFNNILVYPNEKLDVFYNILINVQINAKNRCH